MSVKQYIVEPLMSIKDVKALEGSFLDESYYHTLIDHDADVYWNDNGTKRLLVHFRKGVIPDGMLDNAIAVFKKDALKASSIRGTAGGAADPSKISSNVKEVVSKGRYRTKVVFKDGTVSNYYVSNKVNSMIAGYFDKERVIDRKAVLAGEMIPCRTTLFTQQNTDKWQSALPLLELVDQYYKQLEPETHSRQLALASKTPEFQISDTAFSTLTVNCNWRTACHVDAGDFKEGYSVIFVAEEGQWSGGYLGYPRFGVMVDARHGDFLLKDPHQQHCNTPIVPISKDYTRLSFVVYYRENMQRCVQPQQPIHRQKIEIKQRGGSPDQPKVKIVTKRRSNTAPQLVPARFPNRDIDLELYIRPNTTDEKVITEVLKTNVYEKRSLGFFVSTGDRWLDLGGNIGTFALLALSHGATVVSCEPEPDNLEMLERNLRHNFPNGAGKDWQIVAAAVTVDPADTIDLYLCKGDYNKYRHTIYHKRGRASTKVNNIHVRELLQGDKFNAIKIDIEGAEIDILEELDTGDYVGIDKLVYEYSFDIDPSIPRFLKIIERLRKTFRTVHYTKVKDNELEYKHFPAATMVYCLR